MSDHICGSPNAMCDTDCMERSYRSEQVPKEESDTPRTDTAVEGLFNLGKNKFAEYVPATFARQLERELIETRKQYESLLGERDMP